MQTGDDARNPTKYTPRGHGSSRPDDSRSALIKRFDPRRCLPALSVCVYCGMAWTDRAFLFNPICDRCFERQGDRHG